MELNLRVDEHRFGEAFDAGDEGVGIQLPATDSTGACMPTDVGFLTRESVIEWCKSLSQDELTDVVLKLLGHQGLV
jgi:hypothetical protein